MSFSIWIFPSQPDQEEPRIFVSSVDVHLFTSAGLGFSAGKCSAYDVQYPKYLKSLDYKFKLRANNSSASVLPPPPTFGLPGVFFRLPSTVEKDRRACPKLNQPKALQQQNRERLRLRTCRIYLDEFVELLPRPTGFTHFFYATLTSFPSADPPDRWVVSWLCCEGRFILLSELPPPSKHGGR